MKKDRRYRIKMISLCLLLLLGVQVLPDMPFTGNTAAAETVSVSELLDEIPEYDGSTYTEINGNVPEFDPEDFTTESFESYSDLDELGRCGAAYANVGEDLMPTEKRGDISEIHPTGWVQHTYDIVESGSLYNRCHLIAYELTGENANEKNLITGTRYFNAEGMLPFENLIADYIKETGNHVLYRVTPVFEGDDLVARGVQMEAMSVEDEGEGVEFNIFCYNVQPGITIDYATGENWLSEETDEEDEEGYGFFDTARGFSSDEDGAVRDEEEETYILNTGSMKFHYPDCESVNDISEKNKEEYTGSREDLIEMGYKPCGACKP